MQTDQLNRYPSFKQLVYFVSLAEEKHFRRAAERCGVSQPSLTAQLQLLEEKLGAKLLERSRAGVIVTPVGRDLLVRAKKIMTDVQSIQDAAEAISGKMDGIFKLGVKPTIGPYLLPHAVSKLHKKFPDLKLAVQEGTVSDLSALLAEGQVDLILTEFPVAQYDFVQRPLFREPLLLAMASDHELAKKNSIRLSDLSGETILTLEQRYQLHDQVNRICEEYGAEIQRDYVGTSLDALRQMVGMGMGLTFLPALYVNSEVTKRSEITVRKFNARTIYRQIGFAWRRGAGQTAVYENIAKTTKEVAERLSADLMIS
jgi:LysR family hydrogen peroxide-inducible transcriptional activator